MIHIRDLQKETDVHFKIKIKENICITTVPNNYHYYVYFVPKEFDKISNIEFEIKGEKNIIAVELLIDEQVSSKFNESLELVNCATHSQFAFKIYFKAELETEIRLIIKYDTYEFEKEFKSYLKLMPFQTDNHVYVDNKVEAI